MEVWQLIRNYYQNNPHGHYFDTDTLRFFGERKSEMRVLKGTVTVKDISGNEHVCYCLSSLQRNYPGGPRRKYTWFDAKNFNEVTV